MCACDVHFYFHVYLLYIHGKKSLSTTLIRYYRQSRNCAWSAALAASPQTRGIQDIHLVYRSLAGTASVYLADECTLVTASGRRPLQSADSRTCIVKQSRNQFGDRSFATASPTLWNSLPAQFRQPDITFTQFKRSLKTFMFA